MHSLAMSHLDQLKINNLLQPLFDERVAAVLGTVSWAVTPGITSDVESRRHVI